MKNILLLLFVFTVRFYSLVAQELPNYAIASPTAFELTKYGNMPINETSGKINPSIPFYTLKAGKLSLPIGLSYSGSGVKVDQLSSWTGINWNLMAGGVITRVVKDRPDEKGDRILYTMNEVTALSSNITGINDLNLLETSLLYDTQADLFSFSFLDYSGSFYLDNNLQPKIANYEKELKIDFVGGLQDILNQIIIITDPHGVKFYFGGTNGTEQTRNLITSSPPGYEDFATTSYYLYQISHPNGDIISLTYGVEAGPYNINISRSEVYTATKNGSNYSNGNYSSGTVYNKIYNGKYLSKISSNRNALEIHFLSSSFSNVNFKRVLNDIKVVEKVGSIVNDKLRLSLIYLSSDPLATASRFFLKEAIVLNAQNSTNYKYRLEYLDAINLPQRLSHSKDYLGYFNGRNNSSSLPQNNFPGLQTITGAVLGNRNPVFENSIKGTLSKIIYPTGGNTSFEYEAPQIRKKVSSINNLWVYSNLSGMGGPYPNPDTKLNDQYNMMFAGEGPTPENQQVDININVSAQGSLNSNYKIFVEVYDTADLSSTNVQSFSLSNGTYTYNRTFTFSFLKDHNYGVKLRLQLPAGVTNPAPVDVKANFEFFSGYNSFDEIGLRVKKIIDNPLTGPSHIKRFFYSEIGDIGNLNALPNEKDYSVGFITLSGYKEVVNINGMLVEEPRTLVTIKSEPFYSIFPNEEKFYSYVTTSEGGDNFENGGVQRNYQFFNQTYGINFLNAINHPIVTISPEIQSTQRENSDIFSGKLLKERFFKKENNLLFMTKENVNQYSYSILESATNMVLKRIYDPLNVPYYNTLEGLYIGLYKTNTTVYDLISQSQTDFIEPVPLNDLNNSSNYLKVSSSTQFQYGNEKGLVKKVINTTSENNRLIEVEYHYPSDIVGLNSLGLENLTTIEFNAVKKLQRPGPNNILGQHRLAEILQETTTVKNGSTSLSKTVSRTNFKDLGNNLVLPNVLKANKGFDHNLIPLESKVNFHRYDNFGNPIEISLEEGPTVVYIWGYGKQFPIAKIENATYAEVAAALNITVTTLNNYSDANLTEINNLRTHVNMAKAQITTYTYELLVGIKSIIDPRGDIITYHYDLFNRLQFVKDIDGMLLKENKYNYATN